MLHRAALLSVIALVLGCRGSAPAASAAPAPAATDSVERRPFISSVVRRSVDVDWRVPERRGQLSDSQLVALAPRIARFRAVPDTLRMDITDSLFIARLVRVLALDDDGRVLGEVRRYGFNFGGGLYPQANGSVRARAAGIGVFGANISDRLPGDFRSRGPAQVLIIVTDSTGVGPRAPTIAKGSGVISGFVRDSAGRPLPGVSVQAMRREGTVGVQMAFSISDMEGRYRLDSLPPGPAMITVLLHRFQPIIVEVNLHEGASETRDFRLLPGNPLPSGSGRP